MDEGIRGSMAALTASSPGVAAGQARFGTPFRLSLLGPGTLQSPERERDEGPSGGRAPGVLALTAPLPSATVPDSCCLIPYLHMSPRGTPRGIGDIPRGRHGGKWPGNMVRTRPWGWAATGPPEIVRRHVRPAGGCAMMETRPGSLRRSGPRQRSPGPRRRDGKEGGQKESLRRRCGRAHRAILSGPPKSTARAPSPGPHVCGWCTGDVEMAPRSMLRRLYPTREEGAHARMAMSDSRFPISVCRCRCQSTAARVGVDAGSSAALWRVRLARRRVSSVVVQVNCSEASRVGDGTRREAAVTARRDSWRVSRSTAVEIPMGRGRLGGSWEADGRGGAHLRT